MDIRGFLENIEKIRVLIVGDVMIDSYTWGNVQRISPEAPVPVLNVRRKEHRLGGAANVARNILALGATPVLCAVVGDDEEGHTLSQLMQEAGMSTEGIVSVPGRPTTVKQRLLAASQHLLRIDSETDVPLSEAEAAPLLIQVEKIILEMPIDVVLFEDYDKGVLTPHTITAIMKMAKERNIPVTVDPKKRNFLAYAGATIFKPNLKELREGTKTDIPAGDIASLRAAVRALKAQMPVEMAMITLSEHGVYITDFQEEHHIQAHVREIADVSGAGDTVIAVASCCLALKMPAKHIAAIANLAGGLVCESLGVVPIDKQRLSDELHKITF